MKFKLLFLFFLSCYFINVSAQKSYDVVNVYEKKKLPSDCKVIDNYGKISEAKTLLVPLNLQSGNYEITIRRIDSNLYEVVSEDIIIETKYCYEYASYEKVILKFDSPYSSYSKGKLIFKD